MAPQRPDLVLPPVPAGDVVPRREGRRDLNPLSGREANPALAPEDTSRSWIAQYIVTPEIGAQLRGSLERNASRVEHGQGRTRFVQDRNGRSVEISVDDATGAIMEIRAVEGGQTRGVTERDWTRTENGTLVLQSERVTQYPQRADGPALVITTIYQNIRLMEGL